MLKSIVLAAAIVGGQASVVCAGGPDTTFNWTGFYIGGHGGYANSTLTGPDLSFDQHGGSGGLQMGLNYQFLNHWVIGIEQDVSLGNIDGSVNTLPPVATLTGKFDSLGTLRGRAGLNLGHVLVYQTAGLAWANAAVSVNQPSPVKDDRFVSGFTIGGGVELAATRNVTLKAEYLYLDFPAKEFLSGTNQSAAADAHMQTIRLGVNWLFH